MSPILGCSRRRKKENRQDLYQTSSYDRQTKLRVRRNHDKKIAQRDQGVMLEMLPVGIWIRNLMKLTAHFSQ
ncbi:hypothetical protein HYFRA_00009497 [Hymenoscyphus fraxineus]|uniref:Uncharacterized protein n=1 Tax=Hymenoscyphus fraxineus TaxID=746836 RepID=A0A9N9KZR0_9HELO|nr:hypothetical protein HYFRA_00009497 [Hymenoscyphus fraxineus]